MTSWPANADAQSQRTYFGSIRFRMMVAVLLVMLVPAIVISVVTAVSGIQTQLAEAQDQLVSVATLKHAQVDEAVFDAESNLGVILVSPTALAATEFILPDSSFPSLFEESQTRLSALLNAAVDRDIHVDVLYLVDRSGEVLITTGDIEDSPTFSARRYFIDRKTSPLSELAPIRSGQSTLAIFSYLPVIDAEGQVLAFLVGRASLESFNKIMLERAGLGETGETYLVSQHGLLLTETRFDELEPMTVSIPVIASAARDVVGVDWAGGYRNYRDREVVGTYQWLSSLNAVLVAEKDREEVLAPIYRSLSINVGVVLLATLIMGLAGLVFIDGQVLKPISRLSETALRISEGNLEIRTGIDTPDEIGSLARSFDSMTNRLSDTIDHLQYRVEQIRRQREQAEAILYNIDDAVVLADTQGIVTYVNRAFVGLLGFRPEEVVDLKLSFLSPELELGKIGPEIYAEGRSGSWQRELLVLGKDGMPHEVVTSVISVMSPDGKIESLVLSMRDVGHFRQLDRMKTRFMQHISHELRTPLTNIRLYTRLLKSDRAIHKRDQYLTTLDEQTTRLIRLTEKVLDATRLANPETIAEWETLRVADIVNSVIARFKPQASSSRIDLSVQLLQTQTTVLGNREWLMRALSELVENALKYAPEGGKVSVRTALEQHAKGGDHIVVRVQDSGPGISREELEQIIANTFYRGAIGEVGQVSGMGLGLTITRMIVEHHGGVFSAESSGKPGEGVTFSIVLPVRGGNARGMK